MLDANFVAENRTLVEEGLKLRNFRELEVVAKVVALNDERKKLTHEVDGLRHEAKELSQKIGAAMKSKSPEGETLKARAREVRERADAGAARQGELENELRALLLTIPNLPHKDAIKGGPEANTVRRTCLIERASLSTKTSLPLYRPCLPFRHGL